MPKSLIIVESPTKARTISRFLGRDFVVESSFGHIRDLPKSKLGVDVDNNFEPQYLIPRDSKTVIKKLKAEAKKAKTVILATDEDREGEAIAWHLSQALDIDESKTKRIVFHEITKSAIEEALKNPRSVDMGLVDAQQARRILDRLVGYKLSPFLWKKVYRGLSAGRVQSVAVRLIAEREREIKAFKPQEYWSIEAVLRQQENVSKTPIDFTAVLFKIDGNTLDKFEIKNETEAKKIENGLKAAEWIVESIEKREVGKNPLPPFTTSTLQQEAFRRLRFSAKQTMRIAQQLYEGMELGQTATGLITYMRTDSLNLSEESLQNAAQFLKKEFGENYALSSPRRFKTKSKGAQEAHEAIRPTDPTLAPDSIKESLDKNQYRLYDLIWRRFLASQMPPAVFDATAIEIRASNCVFRANGQTMRFEGFLKIYPIQFKELELPKLSPQEKLKLTELKPEQHFTEPPPRYSEASLVKILEKNGIGRPSTYAPTISTIQDRGYVEKNEKRQLQPTQTGLIVNDLLVEHFPQIVDIQFTAKMEEELDEIAEGKMKWQPIIREFYEPFSKRLGLKYDEVEKHEINETTEEICEKCGKSMVIKLGRFGKFLACSGFPDCKNTKSLRVEPEKIGMKCPQCGEGEIIVKTTKRRKRFFGCSRYPECNYASWNDPRIKKEQVEN